MTAVLLVPNLVLHPKSVPPAPALVYASAAGLAVALFIFLTVLRRGHRMLLWATIVPVAFGVFFLLHFAGRVLGEAYSSRQVAAYIQQVEHDNLQPRFRPVAVFEARRDVEYGLGFYLDEPVERYERGEIPGSEHILVARAGTSDEIARRLGPGRKFVSLGSPFPPGADPQRLEVYWVSSSDSRPR
jgi:hypothetical protein